MSTIGVSGRGGSGVVTSEDRDSYTRHTDWFKAAKFDAQLRGMLNALIGWHAVLYAIERGLSGGRGARRT